MNRNDETPLVALPPDLDDAAAAALLAFFYDAARVLEAHYAGQLLRYHRSSDIPPSVDNDEPPF